MKKTIYLSFETGDVHLVNRFRSKLSEVNVEARFYDLSLKMPCNPQNNEIIKAALKEKISQSDLVICFVSERTADNPYWVRWEVEEALRQGKKIAAVKLQEGPFGVPEFLEKNKIILEEFSPEEMLSRCKE